MRIVARVCLCALLAALFAPTPLAFAKGSADKVIITGPGLAVPIEITDPSVLSQFNPWTGQFVDQDRTAATGTPEVPTPYEVLFYSNDGGGKSQLFYAFYYWRASGARGRVYLPQPQDKWYDMDNYTIARGSGWFYASTDWDGFVERLLSNHQASSSTPGPTVLDKLATPARVGGGMALILSVGSGLLWLQGRRRKTPS